LHNLGLLSVIRFDLTEPSAKTEIPFTDGDTMDKKIAGLLGAAVLTTASAAYAAAPTAEALPLPASYQDLLTPVPNPVAALRADDARLAKAPAGEMKIAQFHHHHHHHRPPPRRRRYHR